jgi:integrase
MAVRRGPNGTWLVEFQLAGLRVHRSTRMRDRRSAEALERRLRQEVFERSVLGVRPPVRCTLGEAVTRYVEEHLRATSKSAKSLRDSEWLLGRLVEHLGGPGVLLQEISSSRVAGLKRDLVALGLTQGTANRYLATLRAILRKANREWEVLPVLPSFQLFALRNERTRVLSADEEQRLLASASANPYLLRLLRFLLATGARLGEALRLSWADVELEHPRRRPHVVFRDTKNGTTRAVPLPAAIESLLAEMRVAQAATGISNVFLCVRNHQRLQPYRRPFDAFRKACRAAGIEDFRLHDCRHTYASRLARAGAPLYKISKLLGHRDPRMTARYAHLADTDLDDLADLVS